MKILKFFGWIFIPYIMIIFQWNKIGKTGKTFGSAWAVIALIVVITNANDDKTKPVASVDSAKTTTATAAESQPAPAPKPVEPSIEDRINNSIIEAVKDKTNMDKDRIVELQVNDHAGTAKEGDKIVIAKMNADENLTNSMVRHGILMQSDDVFKVLFSIPEVEEAALFWQLPITDAY
ncbi:hypothetical protein [Brevibacillus daliensis]|uniref:hypothetical protein n=1 Tax=Brevibacillus daliensis TaxID=2892995 RepID=UPI001E4AF2F6|nr:hypothetical protein [Brevibacillus daliensis]